MVALTTQHEDFLRRSKTLFTGILLCVELVQKCAWLRMILKV
jgi:hypothetical protein